MANYKVTDSELSGIASAIRLKGGTSDPLVFPSGFVSAISAIETQGTYISKTITSNGEYDPVSDNADAFSHVTVSVPSPVLVSKTISSNGTYNPTDDNADAYSQVVVNVSGGANSGINKMVVTGETGSFYDNTISSIRRFAFYSHNGLNEIEMESVETIGSSAFMNCSSLTSISFPECTNIGDYAFCSCISLNSIYLPKVEIIGTSAFQFCSSLSVLDLPSCTSIGLSCFEWCSAMNVISLPKCNRIDQFAFRNCKTLMSIYILNSSYCNIGNVSVFANTPIANSSYTGNYGSIYVPASMVDAYKTKQYWSSFSDRITAFE